MRLTVDQIKKAISDKEVLLWKVKQDIRQYDLGLIGESQHKAHKKFRAKLNSEIKDLKRQLELMEK